MRGVQRRGAVHAPGRRRARTTRCRSSRRSSGWRTPRSRTPRSTWRWSRSGWAARGTPRTSPTLRSRWCCRSRSTTRATSATRPRRSRWRRPGSSSRVPSRCVAEQQPDVAEVLLARRRPTSGATMVHEGLDFGVVSRVPAVGGQVVSLQGLRASLRRAVPAAVRRAPGPERGRRPGRGRGVPGRRAAGRRGGAGGVRRGHLAGPARDRAHAVRRSCSTPRTTRTAPRRPRPPSRTRSRSPR